jgi:hypothetical protein
MPHSTLALGFGHRPDDPHRRTRLDVHLHLDFPEGPLSLGEQSGTAPGVGAQVTLQEIVERYLDHVRACGCEWLAPLAAEEKRTGRRFTPHEIQSHMPPPSPPVQVLEAPNLGRSGKPTADVLRRIREAINQGDFEALESLRDELNDETVRTLAQEWHADLPWSTKDAYASLLQDQLAVSVHPLFRDALNSPTTETRAYALCVLTGDFTRFTSIMTKGGVDATKVDAAIATANLR